MPDENDDESESLPEEDFEDSYVAQAKEELIGRIDGQREDVFYERQLQVSFENDYYHWVTARALEELTEDGEIRSERVPLRRTIMTEDGQVASGVQMRFFFSKKLLYWTRKAKKIAALVEAYSEPTLTKAVGNQAEILFDAALPSRLLKNRAG